MTLFIDDAGDPTVGIFTRTFSVTCPFERDEAEKDDLKFFKEEILSTYAEFAQGRMRATYDFEYTEDFNQQ